MKNKDSIFLLFLTKNHKRHWLIKVGCVFPMVIWSESHMRHYWDDHRIRAPQFSPLKKICTTGKDNFRKTERKGIFGYFEKNFSSNYFELDCLFSKPSTLVSKIFDSKIYQKFLYKCVKISSLKFFGQQSLTSNVDQLMVAWKLLFENPS